MKLFKLVSTKDMPHDEWIRMRKIGIGGSDAGAVCGLSPYSTAISVYMDKKNMLTEKEDTEAMRQGRDLEEYVARRFCEETGKKVKRANAIFQHPQYSFMLANIDRLIVGEDAGLECKTVSAYGTQNWEDGNIPPHYEIQCHHYMAVTGASAWYLACVILGIGFVWKKIERDEELIQYLISIESQFWNENILGNMMPSPDGSDAADEIIKQKYSKSDPNVSIEITSSLIERLERRSEITALIDKLSTEKAEIEQEIKMYMEDAEMASGGRYSVTWKSSVSSRVDTTTLKKNYPDVYKKCCKESTSRRFLIKEREAV